MATSSQVKAGLDDIATIIRTERQAILKCVARIIAAKNALNNLPTQYADVIATIDGYTPTGAFESLAKSEKDTLAAEFVSLRTKATDAETALAAIDFSD